MRIYPHALREANAYYSPDKKALLFGYFPVERKDRYNTPGTIVFTSLSHDVIAHETTHALLDGVHPRFNEPVNADVLAFHEAFADIVALFQHFSYPGVLRDQIARTRGNLGSENLLAQLAQQFGRAAGRGGALRDALGKVNPETGKWEATPPDVNALDNTPEPHDRGAILVAAVFGAFSKIYHSRVADLYRIASDGTGILKEGEIHPDLCNRFAKEAARVASTVLQMCIRAIDYCPPVGITFGDYLRAIVTADYELYPEDEAGARLAFIESFRHWGIHPRNMRSMSEESLLWPTGIMACREQGINLSESDVEALFVDSYSQDDWDSAMKQRQTNRPLTFKPWDLESDRYHTWRAIDDNAYVLWKWLVKGKGQKLAKAVGIVLGDKAPPTVARSRRSGVSVEVHSVRFAQRRTARGSVVSDLVVEITQRRKGYFDPDEQARMDKKPVIDPRQKSDFRYRAGCTLLIDPVGRSIRRVIRTPGTITDNDELERQRRFLVDGGLEPSNAFHPASDAWGNREPFALLHQHGG